MEPEGGWRAFVGLGGNLRWQGHSPRETLEQAIEALGGMGTVEARSAWWRTTPVGPVTDQPLFWNGVVQLHTTLPPEELLSALLAIERQFGRVRDGVAKGPRTLDLDLLLAERLSSGAAEAVVLRSEALTLPHPELHRRKFALAPLAEIAPELWHPVLKHTASSLLAKLPAGDEAVVREAAPPSILPSIGKERP